MSRGGGRARQVFLSAHRCPEVDLPPQRLLEEDGYLDVCPKARSDNDDDDDVSDWSEEDLSLHFSPSVILQSEDEESDAESGFECVDVTMTTQVSGPQGAGLKMVPKRQIQLKKKIPDEAKRAPGEVGGVNSDLPAVCPRSDLFLRQHSMPASLHVTSSSDVIDLVGGTTAGSASGGRRLQKSLSLDETKTKLASSLIKSVLSKRMQVEKSSAPHVKRSHVLPRSGQYGGSVYQVEDAMTRLKTTFSLPLPTSQVIGQEGSPPPTYQQATRVKGEVKGVTQSHGKKPQDTSGLLVTEQRRGSEPITGDNGDDVTNMVSSVRRRAHTSELTGGGESKRGEMPGPASPSGSVQTWPAVCAHEQSSTPQQHCIYAAAPPPHLRTVGRVRGPLSCVPTQLPAPVPHNYQPLTGTVSGPPDKARSWTGQRDQDDPRPAETATLVQPHQQPLCGFRGFFSAPVGGDFAVDVTGSAAPPRTTFGSAPRLMVDHEGRQCFLVEPPPRPRVKMLLDPETGQFVQVVIPSAGSAHSGTLYPVGYAHSTPTVMNPAPVVLRVGGASHAVFSVMPIHPQVAVYPLPLQPLVTPLPEPCDDIKADAE